MKIVTWFILTGLLVASVFGIGNADISNNSLALTLMLLLLTLFSDLKEFDFWGLKGKKPDFKSLESEKAIQDSGEKQNTTNLDKAEREPLIQLMPTATGNFLQIAFEIERLLRIYASVNLVRDIPNNINPIKLVEELRNIGLLTDAGVKQIEAIRWLRNILVHGRSSEVTETTVAEGINVAWNLYLELYNTLYPNTGAQQNANQ